MITQYVLRFLEMMHANGVVRFNYLVPSFYFPKRRELKNFLLHLFKQEERAFDSLTYIFCSDLYLLDINKRFLNHDFFTDIITFNLANKNEKIIGEIYISIDRVRDNSLQLKQPFRAELHRVIFHGALHLCGYKDKTKNDVLLMREREDFYLKKYL